MVIYIHRLLSHLGWKSTLTRGNGPGHHQTVALGFHESHRPARERCRLSHVTRLTGWQFGLTRLFSAELGWQFLRCWASPGSGWHLF